MKTQTRNTLLLVLCALIWGLAFVAQSAGAALAPFAFLACRSWLAVAFLWPLSHVFDAVRRRKGGPAAPAAGGRLLLAGGVVCGTLLFAASAAQQIGITLNPSTAKASFITAMYVVLVPVAGLLFGRKSPAQIWACVVLSVAGLYLLCMQGGFGASRPATASCCCARPCSPSRSSRWTTSPPRLDGVRLSLVQFLVVAVESTAASLLTETVALADITANALPVLYCGLLSSGVGLHPADPGPAGPGPRHRQPGHVPGKRLWGAGRLAAAQPEPVPAGAGGLRPDLCGGGGGPAASGPAARRPAGSGRE